VVEVGEQPGNVGHEGLGVLVEGHGGGFVRSDPRGEQPQGVGALDSAADAALGDYLEHPGLGEQGDVAVQGPGGHVVELAIEQRRPSGAASALPAPTASTIRLTAESVRLPKQYHG
jgi:hypothetical protein